MAHAAGHLLATDIEGYLDQHENKSMLRFITCGSVDDGKSTLIGRLLYDAKLVFEDHRDVSGRRAGDHVPRVLLVAGCVGHDELPALRGEEPVRDVDRDALFALRRKAVHQQCEIDVVALRTDLL